MHSIKIAFLGLGEDPFLRGLLLNAGVLESLNHLPFRFRAKKNHSSILKNAIVNTFVFSLTVWKKKILYTL